jgi:predicted ABC-type transport system involved in lysophospholipase L1 biosynthesis ATPase subunit
MSDASLIEVSGVTKAYGALRPLRIEQLTLAPRDEVAIIGLDQPAAEVLINLLTGAGLPDTGTVTMFGQSSASITDSTAWLTLLDRIGIVSDRAALLDSMTALQNLALPFSLDIEPPPPDVAAQATAIARAAGLDEPVLGRFLADLDPLSRLRVRLGRAIAFNPSVLILEHPSATLPRADVIRFACDVRALVASRGLATLTLTADGELAGAIAERPLLLEPATGRLREP